MKHLDKQISLIDIGSIKKYSEINGWNVVQNNRKDIIEFTSPLDQSGKSINMILPIQKDFLDYNRRLRELFNVISKIKKIDISTIINEIIHNSVDVFKASVKPYEINVEEAYNNIKSLRKLIQFSATSEINTQKNFDNPIGAANSIVKKFNFGHTFAGSFGFVISTNVYYEQKQLSMFELEEIPLQRKTMERIITGLNHIYEAKTNKDIDIIVENYNTGLNAKMCDALLEFSNEGEFETDFSIDWSNNISPNVNIGSYNKWSLDKEDYEIITEAAYKLKEFEPTEIELYGKVVTLHSIYNLDSSDEFNGTAYLKTIIEDRTVDVKLSLNRFNYKRALEAHRSGREICVKGELTKNNTVWELDIKKWM